MKRALKKWGMIAAFSLGGYLLILLILCLMLMTSSEGKNVLAASADEPERIKELVLLKSYGIPSDIVMMVTTLQCTDAKSALEKPFIYNAMEYMEMTEIIKKLHHTCKRGGDGDEDSQDEDAEPDEDYECDCDEYKVVETQKYTSRGAIAGYLSITDETTDLNAENILQRAQDVANEKCGDEEKREIQIGAIPIDEYEEAIKRCGIEKPKDIKGIMDLHEQGYFIKWLEDRAAKLGIAGALEFLGKYPMPASGVITCPFGWRMHPIMHKPNFHTGVDIGTAHHTAIRSVADGKVVAVGFNKYDGRYVLIYHPDEDIPFYSYYGHLSEQRVREGKRVKQGDTIGIEGGQPGVDPEVGFSTGHHLHFEIRMDKEKGQVNPLNFLAGE